MQTARINYADAQRELARQKQLFEQKVIAEQEFNRYQVDANLKKENLEAAENNLEIAMKGASRRTGNASTSVYSTVEGMLLDVPVK